MKQHNSAPKEPTNREQITVPKRKFSAVQKIAAAGGLALATGLVGGYVAGHSTVPKTPKAGIERTIDGRSAIPANQLFEVVDHKAVPVKPSQLGAINERFDEAARTVSMTPYAVELGYPLPTTGNAYAFQEKDRVYVTLEGQELELVSQMLQAGEGPQGIVESPTPSIAAFTTGVAIHPGSAPSAKGQ